MKLGYKFQIAAFALMAVAVGPMARAEPETDAFVNCVTGNTTDEDTTAILKLLALIMASHPDVGDVVTIDPHALAGVEDQVGEYIERLLVIDCLPEARASLQADKGKGMLIASQTVMTSVMQSLQSQIQNSDMGNRMFSKVELDRMKMLLTDE